MRQVEELTSSKLQTILNRKMEVNIFAVSWCLGNIYSKLWFLLKQMMDLQIQVAEASLYLHLKHGLYLGEYSSDAEETQPGSNL